ncbi:M13 family metallopeptidase [Hyphococcus sp.]|uniref:M13 family metallopeptidase n=1 Tax=Hyphococcus sp. TaxID=2038636 RepID=UPI003CCBAA1A
MKKFLLCSAATLTIVACADQSAEDASSTQQESNQPTIETSTAETPELGEWGVEIADIDPETDPGDDFYQYVNGKWLNSFEIPEEFASYGSFTVLFERSEDRVRTIIEDAANSNAPDGSNEQKVGDYFNAYTDVETINQAGYESVADDLAKIDSASTHEDVARIFGEPGMIGNSPFAAFVNVDSKRTDQYIMYITQAGLGMPNRNYYLEDGFADKRDLYKDYIAKVLELGGIANAEQKAQAIYDIEYKMAEVHWEPAKRRNRDLTYNLKTLDELKAFAPEAPWEAMFGAAGLGDQTEFVVREDDAIANLAKIFAETPVESWKAYMTFHHLNTYADVLPSELDDANFAFFGTALRGTPKQRERWKRGVAAVNGAMGEAVGEIYVDQYFPPDSKEQMQDLVANLRMALDERLDTLPWMSEATKEQAHAKLNKFTPKIGYPDKWRDYSGLTVTENAFENRKTATVFQWEWSIDRLGGPVDKTEWGMTPQRVNAYYSPPRNEIVFPAAILQPPFFDPAADPAVNYGGIGAVIGHEIGHGFDDQGRKSDGDGILRDWWTAEDAANFQELADALGGQYETYEPVEGFFIDPELTMGENIGDVGGLAMAYHAYKLSLDGEEAPVIDGFTGDQRFFMSWAQVWKRATREEALKNQVKTDPHSPAEYRVNGVVRNMDEWYAAFDVSEDDNLYLPPEERVQIW